MKRREFLKGAGALVLATTSGSSMMLLEGFSRGLHAQPPIVPGKIPFDDTETLESIRAKIEHNGYSFTVDRNWCYDGFGYPGTPPEPPAINQPPLMTFTNNDAITGEPEPLPSSFDLRNHNGHSYIGPIRNQGGTGLCWGFAACAAAEGAHNFKNGLFDDNCVVLSPMYLLHTLHQGSAGKGDLGVFYALTKTGDPYKTPTGLEGACQEMDFPFAAFYEHFPIPPPVFQIEKSKLAPRVTLKRCGTVFATDYKDTTARIKAAIHKYGAVKVSVRHAASAFKAYKSGIYEDTFTGPSGQTGHDVSLVGWDDNPPEGGEGCWILRNEWGTSWGENGYMRIRYFSALVNSNAVFIEASSPGDGERTIMGSVVVDGTGSGKAILTLTGADTFATASSGGRYVFQALKPGSYLLTPTQPGVIFTPSFLEIEITTKNVAGVDFMGNLNSI
jgi:C1A family cysteine protease